MKVLIYGYKGWIGQQIIKILKQSNHQIILGRERVNHKYKVEQEIIIAKPTNILCLIGRTYGKINNKLYPTIDYLEQKGKIKENIRDNLFSPLVLAILCQKYNIHLTYIGTGCIFKYDDKHPFEKEEKGFTENDTPNFFGSSYSVVKGYTDELMHLFDNVLNIRIRMPLSDNLSSRNFIYKITQYEKICSISNSMTVLPELLPIMIDMVQKNITGTFNMVNPGLISHNRVLELYQEIVDPTFTWQNFSKEEQDTILDADRSNNYLDTTKLTNLYPNINRIETAVINVLKNIKLNNDNLC